MYDVTHVEEGYLMFYKRSDKTPGKIRSSLKNAEEVVRVLPEKIESLGTLVRATLVLLSAAVLGIWLIVLRSSNST